MTAIVLTAAVFVSAIDAIDGHVTSLMRRYTVCLVETVLATRDLADVAIRRCCNQMKKLIDQEIKRLISVCDDENVKQQNDFVNS